MTFSGDDFRAVRRVSEAETTGTFDDSDVRKKEKRKPPRKRKKRKKKRYLLKFALLCLFCGLTYYVINSPIFNIQFIEVENNVHYTSEQIIEKGGVTKGVNIFWIDTENIKNLLQSDPYIVFAKVKREIPARIRISVEEREEAAFLRSGSYVIIIDENGLVLRKGEAVPELTELANLNIIKAEEGHALDVEQNALFSDALSLIKEAYKNDMYFKKIDISGVVMRAYVYDHLICEGTTTNLVKNMRSVKGVLAQLDQQDVQRGILKVGSDRYIAWQPTED